jgi:hypothetical protein
MHPDTLTALRLLASALAAHPDEAGRLQGTADRRSSSPVAEAAAQTAAASVLDDLTALAIYGNIPEHLADALDDYAGDDD